MKIYVACLASYNMGYLHGAWIEPSDDLEELQEAIKQVLKTSPAPCAEEWAIHDYDDFPNMGEYPDLQAICDYVELVEGNEHGLQPDEIRAVLDNFCGSISCAKNALDNNFCGVWDSFRDFTDDRADEELACHGVKDDHPLYRHFDWASYAEEMRHYYTALEADKTTVVLYS